MVRVNYPGLTEPEVDLAQLVPVARMLIDWKMRCQPFGGQYLAISRMIQALEVGSQELAGLPLLHREDVEGVPGCTRPPGPSVESRAAERVKAETAREAFLRRQAEG